MSEPSPISRHPLFAELRRTRHRLAWPMAVATLLLYTAFVAAMAYAPAWLGQRMDGADAISIGLPIGAAVIVLSFALTGLYVWLANRKIEPLLAQLQAEVQKNHPQKIGEDA